MTYDIDSVDSWTADQCEACMLDLNCESRNDVAANLEFYREHCRYLISDNKEGIARDLAVDLSIRNPNSLVQIYRTSWGSYIHRFEAPPVSEIEGRKVDRVATYRKGSEVRFY